MWRSSSRRSLEAALRDLDATKPAVRAAAASDLALHADADRERVVEALRAALQDADAHVRGAAALALADAHAEEAVSGLVAACEDHHGHVVSMALTALGELASSEGADVVAKHLKNESAPVRFQAVMAFPRVAGDRAGAISALLEATEDDDPLIRHIALRMAEELGSDDGVVEDAFLERAKELLSDDSDVVRIASAVVLGRAGRRDGARILIDVAARRIVTSEAEDEAAAIELCGALGLESSRKHLEQRGFARVLLFTRDPFAWQARVALAALGHRRAVRWVLEELRAWTRERRSLAVAAAGRAGLHEARELIEAMRGDDARADQDAVEEALARLG